MRKKIITIAAGLAVLAGMLLATAVTPAAAAPGSPGPPPGVRFTGNASLIHQIVLPHAPHTHLPVGLRTTRSVPRQSVIAESENWAGYADQACGTCHLRFISGNFTSPSINCTGVTTVGTHYLGQWAGLDGLTDSTVEQTGMAAYCDTSTPVYYVWYEMYPDPPVLFGITGFGPGDAVSVAVFFDQVHHDYDLALDDITQDVGFTASSVACPAVCDDTSAEMITEDPGGAVNSGIYLADFGQVSPYNATVTSYNATHGNLGDEPLWTSYDLYMFTGAVEMAAPSALSNLGNDSAFSVAWDSSG